MLSATDIEASRPASELCKSSDGQAIVLYEGDKAIGALVSMEDFEIVRQAKIDKLLKSMDVVARRVQELEIDDATIAELLAE